MEWATPVFVKNHQLPIIAWPTLRNDDGGMLTAMSMFLEPSIEESPKLSRHGSEVPTSDAFDNISRGGGVGSVADRFLNCLHFMFARTSKSTYLGMDKEKKTITWAHVHVHDLLFRCAHRFFTNGT